MRLQVLTVVVLWQLNFCGPIWYQLVSTYWYFQLVYYLHSSTQLYQFTSRHVTTTQKNWTFNRKLSCLHCWHTLTQYKTLQYCVTVSQSISLSRHSPLTKNICSTTLLHICQQTSIQIQTDPVKTICTNIFTFNFNTILPSTHKIYK